jgi:hypothetical protein
MARDAAADYIEALEASQSKPPVVDPPATDPPVVDPPPRPARATAWFNAHDAAQRSPAENKSALLGAKRATRKDGPPRTRKLGGWTWGPGEAPDVADLDVFSTWQWAFNVARGRDPLVAKTGNVDLARCSFQPAPEGTTQWPAWSDMKWGMRRYNLGDATVTDCDFTGIPKEHGIYDSLAGHGLYRGCTFLDLGSQAIQLAYRDQPYQQYGADNMPLTGTQVIGIEDCHAVDCGNGGSRPSFAFTLFDPGTVQHPGIVLIRDSSVVSEWPVARERGSYREVPIGTPRSIRAIRGLVVHQYQQTGAAVGAYATSNLLVDNCVFDLTSGEGPIASIRGVGEILVQDSTFLARDHQSPVLEIDGNSDANSSGVLIIEDCLSPAPHTVRVEVRGRPLMFEGAPVTLHTPGVRLEIDLETLEVTSGEPAWDRIEGLVHPLSDRAGAIPSGVTAQPVGHVDDLGAATELVFQVPR